MQHAFIRSVLPGAVTLLVGAAATAAMAIPAVAATAAQPANSHSKVFVSTRGKAGARDISCGTAAFRSIGTAVSAVASGGTVVVCGGTYHEAVQLAKPVSLLGQGQAEIDAVGQTKSSVGILVKASHVKVSGMFVTGAVGEGILVQSANDVTITRNVVTQNNQGGQPEPAKPVPTTYRECMTVGQVPGDCGEGIHLMGSSGSTVADNVSTGNSGGILLSDETGPTAHDLITGNVVTDNAFDCGITVVGHHANVFSNGKLNPKFGVYDNVITGNTLADNGVKGQGAGVVLATGLPGGAVYGNTVARNTISGNGISGVTVHSHVPGQFLNGNVIEDNLITVNNLDGDNDFAPHVDDQTTGVFVGTVSPLSITVSGNEIVGDHFGIWTTGPVTLRAQGNVFAGDNFGIVQVH
jgi:parallel beta-helix repeat protein